MSKRILSLWMVLLLFAGLAGNAQAAVADPQGVSIRVNSPADDTWAGIGDDIVVYVNAFTNVSPDSIQVALSSSADAEKYGDLAIIEVEVDSVKTGDDAKGLSKTWIVTYDVGTGTIETTEKDVVVQVRMVFGTAAKILTNQSEDTITGTSSTEVGDQVKFGIDEVRPSTVGTGIVVTVAIDTAGTASYLGSATQRAFKIDDEVKISLAVLNATFDATVLLVEVDSVTVYAADQAKLIDRAVKQADVGGGALLEGSVTSTFTLAEGDFEGDNIEMLAITFLTDQAGNLSTTSSGGAVEGFSDAQVHIFDVTPPDVEVAHPDPTDAPRFTGDLVGSIDVIQADDGATDTETPDLNPLAFNVKNEDANSVVVTFAAEEVDVTLTAASFTASDDPTDVALPVGTVADRMVTVTSTMMTKPGLRPRAVKRLIWKLLSKTK